MKAGAHKPRGLCSRFSEGLQGALNKRHRAGYVHDDARIPQPEGLLLLTHPCMHDRVKCSLPMHVSTTRRTKPAVPQPRWPLRSDRSNSSHSGGRGRGKYCIISLLEHGRAAANLARILGSTFKVGNAPRSSLSSSHSLPGLGGATIISSSVCIQCDTFRTMLPSARIC